MKLLPLLAIFILTVAQTIAQPFPGKATVSVEQKWNNQSGKKLRYDWVVKDASGKVLNTYNDYHLFEPFSGNIYLVGRGFGDAKMPYRRAQSFGLINIATGQEIFPSTAYTIEKVSACLIHVVKDRKYYLLKPNGEMMNNTPYDYADAQVSGKPAKPFYTVRLTGKAGFIDSCGNPRTPLVYDDAWNFDYGVARIKVGDKWTWLNESFKEVGPPRFTYLGSTYKGVVAYSTTGVYDYSSGGIRGGKLGLINLKGELLTEEIYDDVKVENGLLTGKLNGQWVQLNPSAPATAATNAIAAVPVVDREFHKQVRFGYYKYGYRLGGQWLVKPKYDIAYEFQNGYAIVGREGKDKITTYGGNEANAMEYGLVNTKGDEIISTRYKALWLYEKGFYGFAQGKGKYSEWNMGIIDSTGTVRVPAEYNQLGEMREGLIPAKKLKSSGYININGKIIIPFNYFMATPFVNGYAAVADKEDSWFWIDKTGKEVMNGKRFTNVSDWDSTGKAWAWHKMDKWNRPDSALLLTAAGKVVGSRPLNGPPSPPIANRTRCTRCNGSGQAYKARDVNSSFTWTEGMFKPVETRTTYSYGYRVYEKDGACPKCRGTGYEN